MRTLYAAGLVLAGLGVLAAAPAVRQAQSIRIAYLNSDKLLLEAPGAQEAKSQIEQEMNRYGQRVQILQDSLNALMTDYQKQSVLLSPDEKKKREDALIQKRNGLNQRAQFIQEEADRRQQELMDPITKKIEAVIDSVRKEGGYQLVFDTQSRAIVSADTTLDLTNKVIARLKATTTTASKK